MPTLLILFAAGSLKSAFVPLLLHFQQRTGIPVEVQFGPAGLLRERIEAGEKCSLFASANTEHPQALLQKGLAKACYSFAANRLMLTVRRTPLTDQADCLFLLSNTQLRLATSTPICDPSGDYTWQFFDRVETNYPGVGHALMTRARQLVGGRDSLIVPPGVTAGEWLIKEDLADLFVGYAHYVMQITANDVVRTLLIPDALNIRCEYQLAQIAKNSANDQLCRYILGKEGQGFLREAGFLSYY